MAGTVLGNLLQWCLQGSIEDLHDTVVSGSEVTLKSTHDFFPNTKAQFGSQLEASGLGSSSPSRAVTAGHAGSLIEAPAPGGSLSAQQASAEAPGPGAAGSHAAVPTANQNCEPMLPHSSPGQLCVHS